MASARPKTIPAITTEIPAIFQPEAEPAIGPSIEPAADLIPGSVEPAAIEQTEPVKEAEKPAKTCSKCGGALDTKGNPQWCKSCQATYRREYNSLRLRRAEVGGFTAGAEAMRAKLVKQFGMMPPLYRIGPQGARELIAQCPLPQVPDPAQTAAYSED